MISDDGDLLRLLQEEGVQVEDVVTLSGKGHDLLLVSVASGAASVPVLTRLVPKTGRWPIVVGRNGAEHITEAPYFATLDPAETLARARELGSETHSWFRDRWALFESEDLEVPEDDDFRPGDRSGYDFVSDAAGDGPTLVALPQTALSWETPAYLAFGGWNDCPLPHEHVALLERWHRQYRADATYIDQDILIATVRSAPQTEEDARRVAWEHFVYDPDCVYQGTDTLGALASALAGNDEWRFWWD